MSTATTVIIADDHPLFRTALREALKPMLPGAALVEADSFDALVATLKAYPEPDLILLDLHMPGVQGFSSLIWLRGERPEVPVVVISGLEDPAVMRRSLDFGASGFIPKSSDLNTIAENLRTVLDGGLCVPAAARQAPPEDSAERQLARKVASLSPQQFRVMMMLADGRLNKQIGYELEVTEATVKAHVTAILRKLGLYRRTQAAVLAQRLMQTEAASLKVDDVAGPAAADDDAA